MVYHYADVQVINAVRYAINRVDDTAAGRRREAENGAARFTQAPQYPTVMMGGLRPRSFGALRKLGQAPKLVIREFGVNFDSLESAGKEGKAFFYCFQSIAECSCQFASCWRVES